MTKSISTVCGTPRRQKQFLSNSTFYTLNLFVDDRCVHCSPINIPAVRILPRRQSPWCALYRWVKGAGESISTVCIILRRQSPWYASHRGDNHRVVHHTEETNCTVLYFTCLRLLLKRESNEIILRMNKSIMKEKIWSLKCGYISRKKCFLQGVLHTGETYLW